MKKRDEEKRAGSLERNEVCRHLQELADEEYRVFHSRLCPGVNGILGVRTPVLRNYAKEILKQFGQQVIGPELYFLQPKMRSVLFYEEKMLCGMLLGLWKAPSPEALKQMMEQFLLLVDNWAVCDVTCGGLKYIGRQKEYFYPVLQQYLKSSDPYTVRFGVVLLMDYYIEETYLEELCYLYEQVHQEDYYVKMAVAWAYSILLVKFYEPVFTFLKQCCLDRFTFQKTVQKACESRRISAEQKERLRQLKKEREDG